MKIIAVKKAILYNAFIEKWEDVYRKSNEIYTSYHSNKSFSIETLIFLKSNENKFNFFFAEMLREKATLRDVQALKT